MALSGTAPSRIQRKSRRDHSEADFTRPGSEPDIGGIIARDRLPSDNRTSNAQLAKFTTCTSAYERRAVLAASLARCQPCSRDPTFESPEKRYPCTSIDGATTQLSRPSSRSTWRAAESRRPNAARPEPGFRMDGHGMVTNPSIRIDMDHDGAGVRSHQNGGFPDYAARSETDQYGLTGISGPPRSITPAALRRERPSRFRRSSRVCRPSPSRAARKGAEQRPPGKRGSAA